MEKYMNIMQEIDNKEYTVTDTKYGEKIKQSEAIELKAQLQDVVVGLIKDTFDLDVYLSDKGVILQIPNKELGAINVELQLVTKPLDMDVEGIDAELRDKQEAKALEKAKKAKAAAEAKEAKEVKRVERKKEKEGITTFTR